MDKINTHNKSDVRSYIVIRTEYFFQFVDQNFSLLYSIKKSVDFRGTEMK